MKHNSAEYLHTVIEAMQLSFADSQWYCADPSHISVPIQGLLDKTYAAQRRALIKPNWCVYVLPRSCMTTVMCLLYACLLQLFTCVRERTAIQLN